MNIFTCPEHRKLTPDQHHDVSLHAGNGGAFYTVADLQDWHRDQHVFTDDLGVTHEITVDEAYCIDQPGKGGMQYRAYCTDQCGWQGEWVYSDDYPLTPDGIDPIIFAREEAEAQGQDHIDGVTV